MAKIPLVLVVGLLCDKEVWEDQINSLSDIAEIVVPDLSKAETPSAMVEAVLKVAPLNSFYLAGHSMGAWVAVEVAIQYPERVTKLCLIDTNVDADSAAKSAFRNEMIKKVENGQIDSVVNQLTDLFTFTESVKAKVKNMFSRNAEAFVAQEKAMLKRRNCLPLLASIQCPTLIIHATQDKVFSVEQALELQKNLQDAKLEIIEDSGHMVTMERPEAVSALLRLWLM
jgi:pimeloyl-ACP methyl ester carboxylesterase